MKTAGREKAGVLFEKRTKKLFPVTPGTGIEVFASF
jgi:hypothetical protein